MAGDIPDQLRQKEGSHDVEGAQPQSTGDTGVRHELICEGRTGNEIIRLTEANIRQFSKASLPGLRVQRRNDQPAGTSDSAPGLGKPADGSAKSDSRRRAVREVGMPQNGPVASKQKANETQHGELARAKVTPPQSNAHEKLELDLGKDVTKQLEGKSLNQLRAIQAAIRENLEASRYKPQEPVLGHGTQPNNPTNPNPTPENPNNLDQPNPQRVDVLKLVRQAREQSQSGQQSVIGNTSSLEALAKREEALRTDPLNVRHMLRDGASSSNLTAATPEQRRVYARQQEFQALMEADTVLSDEIYDLQTEYAHNGWQEDSHWYGLDDKKFLEDINSRNLRNVSDYDKFRVLAAIDRAREQNPDVFKEQDLTKLMKEQRELRQMIEGTTGTKIVVKIDKQTGKETKIETEEHKPGLEHNVRTQIVQRLRNEVLKVDVALGNQQTKQGIVSNAADGLIGRIGTSGGWGGMFLDSDATTQAVVQDLEKARQSSQRLLALSEFSGSNLGFIQEYQKRSGELGQSLQQASADLTKMANAHKGRVEGISDIVQITASVAAVLACASTAPTTAGGSLAEIPIAVPMAYGAAGKLLTKMLESETTATRGTYTLPHIVGDAAIAAISSCPLLPGSKLGQSLLQAESTVVKQVAAAEGKQLAVQAASSPLALQQMRQAGINLAKQFSELTPQTATEMTVKYTAQVGKQTAGYSLAAGLDGATVQGFSAGVKGEDPLKAGAQGFLGGVVLGPVVGPAIKYGGSLAKRGLDWLKTNGVSGTQAARDAAIRANTTYTTAQVRPGINIKNTVEFAKPSSSTTPGLITESNSLGQSSIIVDAQHSLSLAQHSTPSKPEPTVGIQHPADNIHVIPQPGRQFLHMAPDPENPEGHFLSGSREEHRVLPASESSRDSSRRSSSSEPDDFQIVPAKGPTEIIPPFQANTPAIDPIKFADFDQAFNKWADAVARGEELRRTKITTGFFEDLRAIFSKTTKEKRLHMQSSQEIDALRKDLEAKAAALTPQARVAFAAEYARRSLKEQEAILKDYQVKEREAGDHGAMGDCLAAHTYRDRAVEKQRLVMEVLSGGPPAKPVDPTINAAFNPDAHIRHRIIDIERQSAEMEIKLRTGGHLRQQLGTLEKGNGLSRWWNKDQITQLRSEIAELEKRAAELSSLPERLYKDAILGIKTGDTAIIGGQGDIPVFGASISRHAQLKRLHDGTYALTDGFDGQPSCSGLQAIVEKGGVRRFGRQLTPSEYGTFVKRTDIAGKVSYESVSATSPTIVRPGDEIIIGNRPDSDALNRNHYKLVIPETSPMQVQQTSQTILPPPPGRQILHMTPDENNPEGHFLSGTREERRVIPTGDVETIRIDTNDPVKFDRNIPPEQIVFDFNNPETYQFHKGEYNGQEAGKVYQVSMVDQEIPRKATIYIPSTYVEGKSPVIFGFDGVGLKDFNPNGWLANKWDVLAERTGAALIVPENG